MKPHDIQKLLGLVVLHCDYVSWYCSCIACNSDFQMCNFQLFNQLLNWADHFTVQSVITGF